MNFKARTWKVGDNINTDLILPIQAFYLPAAEQPKYVFHANRPGWVDLVKPGDILIGGKNFGMGSSRPAARSLKNLGIACLVAPSINGLFFRNCVNFAFPAVECPGVDEAFEEGDIAEVDFDAGVAQGHPRANAERAAHAAAAGGAGESRRHLPAAGERRTDCTQSVTTDD